MLRIHDYLPAQSGRLACICACFWISSAGAVDLLQSYQAALGQDATYAASRAAASASREGLDQAWAQLLPNISATGSRHKNDLVSTRPDLFGNLSSSQVDYNSSQYSLTLRQPLYRKYQFALYEQAKAQVQGADASQDKDLQDLGVRVAGAYFNALLAQDQRALILSQKAAYAAQLDAAKRSFQVGLGTRTDIDEAQSKFDMALAQELEAKQNTETTRRELQAIINQPVNSLSTLDAVRLELLPPNPASVAEWVTRAEETSPELRNLRAQKEAAGQEVEKARAGHHPTVDLIAQRDRSQSANATTVNALYLTTQLGVQVSIPIFSGGQVSSSIRQALANLDKVEQQYEAARRNIGVQVQKEFQGVDGGILKVRALEQASRSAEQAVYSTQKGLQAGTRTQLDVLNAQQQRVNALRDLAQARYLYLMSRIRLMGLIGSLGVEEVAAINRYLSDVAVSEAVK